MNPLSYGKNDMARVAYGGGYRNPAPKETSIDDFVGRDDETRMSDFLVDYEAQDRVERDLAYMELRRELGRYLDNLPDREKTILIKRFGLDGKDEMTLEEIGNTLGLSRERVRQLERDAKNMLRKKIVDNFYTPLKGNGRKPAGTELFLYLQ